ncbi:MAG: GIY-YIG nuclease family protein [Candidatus Omnitrophota bacterium]
MAYIYILVSQSSGKYYIGCTAGDIESRVRKHQRGEVSFTKRNLPVKLVLAQKCSNMLIARAVEKKIKSLKRKDYISRMVLEGRIKILDRYLKSE